MVARHHVVLGNGAAANAAAFTLREHDRAARITLISDERDLFYYRHLLPAFVVGEKSEAELAVRTLDDYRAADLRLRLGQRVQQVDVDRRELLLRHREKVHFDTLVLCTGSRPEVPDALYALADRFVTLRTLDEARDLRARLSGVRRVVLVGGDLTGVHLARVLARSGREVVFLVDPGAFWPLSLDEAGRAEVTRHLAADGLLVIADDRVVDVAVEGSGRVVRLASGRSERCDLAVSCFGLRPNVDFLIGCGLDVERGVLVDEFLRTSAPGVLAAGDCAQIYNPAINNWWVSVGWGNAGRLGRTAALNALGDTVRAGQAAERALEVEGIEVRTSWWRKL